MLRYEVRQVHLDDKGLYCLPIPKLNSAQFSFIGRDLRARGFSVTEGKRLNARLGADRFAIRPDGLAWSSSDLLDAVVPSIVRVMGFPKEATATNPYYFAKAGRGYSEVQFFPRLEALGRWTSLRRQDGCGLTPDEAKVIEALLGSAKQELECVTDYPTDGCRPMQLGRHQYYRSRVPAPEFLSNLRTVSKKRVRNCYLPRTSVLRLEGKSTASDPSLSGELGEWCYFRLPSKNL